MNQPAKPTSESKSTSTVDDTPQGKECSRDEKKAAAREAAIYAEIKKIDRKQKEIATSKNRYYYQINRRTADDWRELIEKITECVRAKCANIIAYDFGTKDGCDDWIRVMEPYRSCRGTGNRELVAEALKQCGYTAKAAEVRAYEQEIGKVQGLDGREDEE